MASNEAELTVLHRGVPIGVVTVASIGPRASGPRRRPLGVFTASPRGALDTATDLHAGADDDPFPADNGFRPLAGYAAVRGVVRLAGEAFERMGHLGPAGDPKSAARGGAALAAAADLWEELDLVDERGLPAAGRVIWLLEMRPDPTPYYWVVVSFERTRAPVPAWLRPRRGGDAGFNPPAV